MVKRVEDISIGEISIGEIFEALDPSEVHLVPRFCPVDPSELCAAYMGLVWVRDSVNKAVDEAVADVSLASVIEAPCSRMRASVLTDLPDKAQEDCQQVALVS